MTADEPDAVATRQKIRARGGIGTYRPDSAVDQAVAARIARARQREAEAKRRRQELADARRHGVDARNRRKLAFLDARDRAETGPAPGSDGPAASGGTR